MASGMLEVRRQSDASPTWARSIASLLGQLRVERL